MRWLSFLRAPASPFATRYPALSRYDKTGALTVVISPLVALMADQVSGLEARGIGSCVTVNGLLSMPERADALDRVRMGDGFHFAHLSGAVAERIPAWCPVATGNWCVGAGRGPLSFPVGARFPARLPLCRAFHPGKGRGRAGPAGALPDRDRQARGYRRDRGLLPG